MLGSQYMLEGNNVYTCSLCGLEFKKKRATKIHIEAKHFPTDKGYICHLCGKSSNSFNAYNAHMSRHNNGQLKNYNAYNVHMNQTKKK